MDWNDLRYVLALGRERTLAGAARRLGVDHTTAGRRLLAIEEALATRLFDRRPDGFHPTHAGVLALARAREIEQHTLGLEREIAGHDTSPAGKVRLTALDSIVTGFVVPHLGPFYERYPGIELSLVSDIRLFDLSRREADVGLRYSKPKDPNLVGRRLGTQAQGLYASRAYLRSRAKTKKPPLLIGVPEDFADTNEARFYDEQFPKAFTVMRTTSPSTVVAAVCAGLGIGLVECVIARERPELQLVSTRLLVDELWTVVHVDMKNNARVRALVDYLTELVAEHAEELNPSASKRSR